jgi:hypothetical protein
MSLAGFENAIPATERPKTYALDGAATGIGTCDFANMNKKFYLVNRVYKSHYVRNITE